MKFLTLASVLLLQFAAFASGDLKASFQQMEKASKGPFGKNVLQTPQGKVLVTEAVPSGWKVQFQAAYRTGAAEKLVEQDFYVGNLFTTNYYELMGEYLHNDPRSNHALDHAALIAKGSAAMPKAASMARHWVLEKYYVEHFTSSPLAKSFQIRGIGGSEFELVYASYFLNFYFSSLSDDFQYLPGYLLANKSPLADSSSLEKARNMIASAYERHSAQLGAGETRVKKLFAIRNMIHNQLSPIVIAELDKYMKEYPKYKEEGLGSLAEIRTILRTYFDFSVDRVAASAGKLNQPEIKAIAETIAKSGATPENLLKLSTAVANFKTAFVAAKSPTSADSLQLIINTSLYLNKELSSLKEVASRSIFQVAIDTAYMEGFLIQDNWQYFKGEAANATTAAQAVQLLSEVLEIGTDSLNQAFTPAFDQWKSIEPKMENFVDDTVKSSSLNTLSLIALKLKGQ